MLRFDGKSLIFADLHIGVRGDLPSMLNLSIKAVDEILKIAVNAHVSNLIFLGDWFNSREYVSSISLTIAYNLVEIMAQRFNVLMISGNHDLESNSYRYISPLFTFSNIDNVHVFHDITEFSLNGKLALAVPWGFVDYETDHVYDYIFGHLNVNGSAIRYNRVVNDITDNSTYVPASMNDVRTFAKKLKQNGVCR